MTEWVSAIEGNADFVWIGFEQECFELLAMLVLPLCYVHYVMLCRRLCVVDTEYTAASAADSMTAAWLDKHVVYTN